MLYNVLSIDPGEKCGYACSDGTYGLWDFKLKRDENFAYKIMRFEACLLSIMSEKNIQLVTFERVSGINSVAIMSHSKFVCIIELHCTKQGIPFKGYSASEIKKFATGIGNAKKDDMIKAAVQKFKYRSTKLDDNVADAICLLNLTLKDINGGI